MTNPPAVPQAVGQWLRRLAIEVSAQELALLSRYLDLLLETNKLFNLTAVRDRGQAWRRHIIDSLTLVPMLADAPAGAKVIDVGSGGGLPGVPLAICRGDLAFTLLEATGKKARFLERCAADLALANVTVVCARAETVGQNKAHRQRYDLAVCRAVGPMRQLLEYTLPLLRVGGEVLAMKGARFQEELAAAADALHLLGAGDLEVFDAYPSSDSDHPNEGVIIRITKERPTPKTYPRAPGTPRHEPL